MAVRYTRANTLPGTPERQQVNAREYAERKTREAARGLTYYQARQLRHLYPLTPGTEKQTLRRYGRENLTTEHTRYAIIRAHIARAQQRAGQHLSKTKLQAARVIRGSPDIPDPVGDLQRFYNSVGLEMMHGPTIAPPRRAGRRYDTEPADYGAPDYIPEGYGEGYTEDDYQRAAEEQGTQEGWGWDIDEDFYEEMYEDFYEDFEAWDLGEYSG